MATNPDRRTDVKPLAILPALVAAIAASFAISAAPANAAVSSASIVGKTATLNLDGADDNVTVSVSGGLLVHGQTTGGLNSGSDWNSAMNGDQTVPADGTFTVVVNGGDGNDSLTVLAKTSEIAAATLNGGGGDDVLTGADTNDTLNGGDGNDRLVGAQGTDVMNGGAGNDTLVWNNGDGSDTMNGDAGNDGVEVNGSSTLGDVFTLDAGAGRVRFQRTNLKAFTLDTSTERFQVNGLGGNDSVSASAGVGALTLLSVDGGTGDDTVNGSDGPDLILGGDGNDTLNGGGGDDRLVGDRGTDTMNGGSGDDTLVWNNGDGTDVMNGGDGRDDVEVNGAPAAGDINTVQPNGARIKFDRTNLVPFSLDIGSSETMHDNGLGGDDSITVGNVGRFAVTASGGSGNDTLIGGSSSERFLGGSGNDTINPGGGSDVVSGDEGDDTINVRDGNADVASGGDGKDSVVADRKGVDILDGFESVQRARAPKVGVEGGTVKVSKGIASIRLTCPPMSSGNCTGSLVLRTAKGKRLGGGHFAIAAGQSKTLKVKLPKGSSRLADGHGRVKALVVASNGVSRRLTLAL
jgi:Ca2+-binding RTX toxin-like protein